MATEKLRFTLILEPGIAEKVDTYWHERRLKNRNAAINELLRMVFASQERLTYDEGELLNYYRNVETGMQRSSLAALKEYFDYQNAHFSTHSLGARLDEEPIQPIANISRDAKTFTVKNAESMEDYAARLAGKNEAAEEAAPKERRHLTDEEAIALAQERYGHLFGRHDDDEFDIARQAIDAASAANAAAPEQSESTG